MQIRTLREEGGWRPFLHCRTQMPASFNKAVTAIMSVRQLAFDSILQMLPIELIFEIINFASMQVEWWL